MNVATIIRRNVFFFFQAEDGIRDVAVTGVQTCALPIGSSLHRASSRITSATRRHCPDLETDSPNGAYFSTRSRSSNDANGEPGANELLAARRTARDASASPAVGSTRSLQAASSLFENRTLAAWK